MLSAPDDSTQLLTQFMIYTVVTIGEGYNSRLGKFKSVNLKEVLGEWAQIRFQPATIQ